VGETENELIVSRALRQSSECKESAIKLMSQFGKPLDLEEGTEKDREDKIIEFLDEFMTLQSNTKFLDLKYFSKYNGSRNTKGFKLSIDGIHNTPSADYYFCLYSINPPGEFYGPKPSEANIRANTFFDWDRSTYNSIFYTEGYVKYGEVAFDPYAHFVVDIRKIKMSQSSPPKFTKVAWTIVPIFTEDGYVNSGIYQIPLFKGTPSGALLKEMATQDPWEYLQRQVQTKGNAGLKYWSNASVFVRLLDS
jgi:hypothetical protein